MAQIITTHGQQRVSAISGEVLLVIDQQRVISLRVGDHIPDGALLLCGDGAKVRLVALYDPRLGSAPENQVQSWSESLVQQLLQHYQSLRPTEYPAERLQALSASDFGLLPSPPVLGDASAHPAQISSSVSPLFVAPSPSQAQQDVPSSSNTQAFAIERTGAHILASAGFDTGHAAISSRQLADAPALFAPEMLGAMAGSVQEDVRLRSEGQLWLEHAPVDAIFTPVTLSGRFGELQLDAQGVWRYLLNNGAAQVQALREGE